MIDNIHFSYWSISHVFIPILNQYDLVIFLISFYSSCTYSSHVLFIEEGFFSFFLGINVLTSPHVMFSITVFHFMRVSVDGLWAYGHSKMPVYPKKERASWLSITIILSIICVPFFICKKCFFSLHGVFGPVICQIKI